MYFLQLKNKEGELVNAMPVMNYTFDSRRFFITPDYSILYIEGNMLYKLKNGFTVPEMDSLYNGQSVTKGISGCHVNFKLPLFDLPFFPFSPPLELSLANYRWIDFEFSGKAMVYSDFISCAELSNKRVDKCLKMQTTEAQKTSGYFFLM